MKFMNILILLFSGVLASPLFAQDSLNVRRCSVLGDGWEVVYNVEIRGLLAYVAAGSSGIRIVDVVDPEHPVEVGSCSIIWQYSYGFAHDLTLAGNYAYVSDYFWGVVIVDISDPSAPFPVRGRRFWNACIEDVIASGSYLYVNAGVFYILDISNPPNTTIVGQYSPPCVTDGMTVSGNYAYLADQNGSGWGGNLRILDVTDPAHPTEAGVCEMPDIAWDVAVSGNYAYVADGGSGLRIVDITNPNVPFEIGYYNTSGGTMSVTVSGHYAYLADNYQGLRVIDVTNPNNPVEVGYYLEYTNPHKVAVSGCVAYVVDFQLLRIYDISHFSSCPSIAPAAPNGLTIQFISEILGIRLDWPQVASDVEGHPLDVDHYIILRGDSTMDSIGMPDPPDTNVFFDSTAMVESGKFFYQVKAVRY